MIEIRAAGKDFPGYERVVVFPEFTIASSSSEIHAWVGDQEMSTKSLPFSDLDLISLYLRKGINSVESAEKFLLSLGFNY